ncbi:M81 family metallopeptidase [Defluviimonas aestuarii]|uniref:M81 family metallopeptidase n=1 Tax=Albidovulum aestuarii TaxID=1130726 RepID=UPI00249A124C|nr:M81 family metallopeptidase [Defluviimonas aestuarii]MDI3337141.1 M81 family metallopeptidase [Defluviimonas aestuarii]
MTRIAIAGFQHETNTFTPGRAGMAEFEMADSWPALLTGTEVIEGTRGMNLPIAGFAAAAGVVPGLTLVPILWCAAEPSGPVTDDAFDVIVGRIVDGVRQAGAVDAVYLDLHGAMVTESLEDGEGELLRRLCDQVGPDLPVVVSLDLHANLTAEMVRHTNAICIYRTYPHLDMAETGARAFAALQAQLRGQRPAKAFRQVPYLVPLHAQHTGSDPARALYAGLDRFTDGPSTYAELALGFTAADIADAGPAIVAYAPSESEANRMADTVLADMLAVESRVDCTLLSPAVAVARAMAAPPGRPVVIADVQDNPGAGGTADTTGLLRALVDLGATGAILGLMHDPELARTAHHAGAGAVIAGAMGGRSGIPGDRPFIGQFRVETLSDGQCHYTGEMYGGGVATLGPSAVLRVIDGNSDVRVVVTSIRNQCLDRAQFTHFGLRPEAARIVCVKSTAHFRADFEPLAREILLVNAPGTFPCVLSDVVYKKLRPGVRLGPSAR